MATSSVGAALLVSVLLPIAAARGQDLEPRQYSDVPVGLNFLVAAYADSDGSVLVDPAIQLDNANVTVKGPAFGYARSLAFGDLLAKLDAAAAHVCVSGSAVYRGERVTRDVCGLTDARVRLGVNFLGAKAVRPDRFVGGREGLVVGASLQLGVPIGDYDSTKLVNIGTNRWSAKTELGVAKTIRLWSVELALAATLYEDNDEFYGGSTRGQDPLYSLQAHVVRVLPSGIWVAVDTVHYRGGRTIVDGVANRDLQSNSRLGLTVSMPVNGRQSVKLNLSRGVATRTGSDFDTLGVAWQYRWGRGF
ncbi:MAG TPA: transporter [Gammaproteobacteria bacterium]|nr:transporter [Gammaproteobacteria bacterium]